MHQLHLPAPLSRLRELASNLRWSWHRPTQELFRDINRSAWNDNNRNPIRQLKSVSASYLDELAADKDFVDRVNGLADDLRNYLMEPRWFQQEYQAAADGDLRVAYFSPEFGISEALPQYSGGLGVLAGDHLKTASDMGLPLVGVGLFYEYGYFVQELRWNKQHEVFPSQDAASMGLTLCEPKVSLDLNGETVTVRIWRVNVGRVPLYLLDTAHDDNPPHLRSITDRLYGGDKENRRLGGDAEHRLLQEIVLGIGGVKALEALNEPVSVYHSNEGHAGFSGLERVRQLVMRQGLSFDEAVTNVRRSTVFTTHTPVAAGIDRFPRWLIDRYFQGMAQDCGVSVEEIAALGTNGRPESAAEFNMAYLGMKMASQVNGVSELHGVVSREMFAELYGTSPDDTPITSVTNGVHPATWTSRRVSRLLEAVIGPDWIEAEEGRWHAVKNVPDASLWELRNAARARLVEFLRQYMRRQTLNVGWDNLSYTSQLFSPNVLTIGFARRAATYKRLGLLFSQPERLLALLKSKDRPVQFVFAGKAHPSDEAGKELIQRVASFAHDHNVGHRLVFVPDYDLGVARALLDVDVWLNTPKRPMEACGTSGEKAVYHGCINASVSDGWWDEMGRHDINGWIIPDGDTDEVTADNVFKLIERTIVPAFYERDELGIPTYWTKMMKGSLATLGPRVSSFRMMRNYLLDLYFQAHQGANSLSY